MGETTSSLSKGTNALLCSGATPLTSAADVLELFGLESKAAAQDAPETQAILGHLPATADELARLTQLEPGPLAAALAELELAGLVIEGEGTYRAAQ
jgi:predicted Rossmann fold nucleotide-binding protein DprA/Smf involved in DNA uptake